MRHSQRYTPSHRASSRTLLRNGTRGRSTALASFLRARRRRDHLHGCARGSTVCTFHSYRSSSPSYRSPCRNIGASTGRYEQVDPFPSGSTKTRFIATRYGSADWSGRHLCSRCCYLIGSRCFSVWHANCQRHNHSHKRSICNLAKSAVESSYGRFCFG